MKDTLQLKPTPMSLTPEHIDYLTYLEDTKNIELLNGGIYLEMNFGVSPQDAKELLIQYMKKKNEARTNKRSNREVPEVRRENYEAPRVYG